jgi:L-asparaginase
MGRYAGSAVAARTGAISGGDMTVEAALAKLMIGLGRYGAGDELRAFLTRDVVGERTPDAA